MPSVSEALSVRGLPGQVWYLGAGGIAAPAVFEAGRGAWGHGSGVALW